MLKGYYKKKEEQPDRTAAESLLGTVALFNDLKQTKEDLVNTVDTKISEIEKVAEEAKSTVAEAKEQIDTKVKEFEKTAIGLIEDIHRIPTIKGENGKDADEVKIEERITAKIPTLEQFLEKVPKLDEQALLKKFILQLPENKASLKVIRETFETNPDKVVEYILSLSPDKFKLKIENINGLREEIASYRNQLATGKGYIHGGGFNNIYSSSTLVSNGLTGLNFTGSGVASVTKDASTGIITVDISGGGSSDLEIGTTTITGGTTTRILYDNAGVLSEYTISGSGTAVAMATAPTFATSITGSYLTASEILITDGSKNIVSAPVATYPSLTELSYVKGVTSSIQTQLDAKIDGSGASTRVAFFSDSNTLTSDADMTFATDTLTVTKLLAPTSVSTPSLISTSALTITPAAGSNLNISLATTGDFAVNTNQLYVDTSTARVGVNTASPGIALEVTGTMGVTNANGGVIVDEAASQTNPTLIPNKADLTTGIGHSGSHLDLIRAGVRVAEIDDIGFNVNFNPGAGTEVRFRVGNGDNTNGASNARLFLSSGGTSGGDPYTQWGIGDAGQQYYMGIDNSDSDKLMIGGGAAVGTTPFITMTTAGLVGIGTTAPGTKVEIGDGTGDQMLTINAGTSDTAALLLDRNSANFTQFASAGGNTYLDYGGDFYIRENYGGSTVVTIKDSTGKVGIGTTDPDSLLDIEGSGDILATLEGSSSSQVGLAIKSTSGTDQEWRIRNIADGTSRHGNLSFRDSTGGVNAVEIATGTGYVGIGTTDPERKLHVLTASAGAATANVSTIIIAENDTDGYIEVMTPNNALGGILFSDPDNSGRGRILYNHADDAMQFQTSASTRMFIDSAGFVGIGTVAPGALLSVAEKLRIDSNGKITEYADVATAGWGVPAIYGSGRVTAQTAQSAAVATYTVGASDGSFEVSGNVNVTASVTHSFSLDVTYTDETNTSRTLILPMTQLGGSFISGGLITNVTGTGPYESPVLHIRAKAATSITIRPSAGTFTSVTYNAEGVIKQIN